MENWTIENFMIVGQAMLKMAGFFWPVLLAVTVFFVMDWRRERVNETR